jgi:hypothetical protein
MNPEEELMGPETASTAEDSNRPAHCEWVIPAFAKTEKP